MELHLSPDLQAKLDKLATETGCAADKLVRDVVASHFAKPTPTSQALDSGLKSNAEAEWNQTLIEDFRSSKIALSGQLIGVIVGAVLTFAGVYFGPYLQQSGMQREQLAKDLADYYSASASEYYADVDLEAAKAAGVDKSSAYYIELYRTHDHSYTRFLAASTKLASEVPPSLRDAVLSIEDSYDKLPARQTKGSETAWFKQLDGLRERILDETAFKNIIWKKRP